jgi:hypothetical protein
LRRHLSREQRELARKILAQVQSLPEDTPCKKCMKNRMLFHLLHRSPEDVDLPRDGRIDESRDCVPEADYSGVTLCWGERVLYSKGVKKYSFVYKMVGNEFSAKIVDLKTPAKKYAFLREGQTINP